MWLFLFDLIYKQIFNRRVVTTWDVNTAQHRAFTFHRMKFSHQTIKLIKLLYLFVSNTFAQICEGKRCIWVIHTISELFYLSRFSIWLLLRETNLSKFSTTQKKTPKSTQAIATSASFEYSEIFFLAGIRDQQSEVYRRIKEHELQQTKKCPQRPSTEQKSNRFGSSSFMELASDCPIQKRANCTKFSHFFLFRVFFAEFYCRVTIYNRLIVTNCRLKSAGLV